MRKPGSAGACHPIARRCHVEPDQLRQDLEEDAGALGDVERARGRATAEQLDQLHAHALARYLGQRRQRARNGRLGVGVEIEIETGHEAHRAHDAQPVLGETPGRLPPRAQAPRRQVGLPAERIVQLARSDPRPWR